MSAAKAATGAPRKMSERIPDKFELPPQFDQEEFEGKIRITLKGGGDGIAIPKAHFPSVAVALTAFASVKPEAAASAEAPVAKTPTTARAAAKSTAKRTPPAKATTPDASADAWISQLPQETTAGDRVSLTLTTVDVDDKKADRILGKSKKNSKAKTAMAYDISVDGKHAGFVLAQGEKKFVIVAPKLSPDNTVHRGFQPALQRLSLLVSYGSPKAG